MNGVFRALSLPFLLERKIDHQMAFFLTMPISRMIPISEITSRSMWKSNNANRASVPAESSVERIVMG